MVAPVCMHHGRTRPTWPCGCPPRCSCMHEGCLRPGGVVVSEGVRKQKEFADHNAIGRSQGLPPSIYAEWHIWAYGAEPGAVDLSTTLKGLGPHPSATSGKPSWRLFKSLWRPLSQVVRALEQGNAKGYQPDDWQESSDPESFYDKAIRHATKGVELDPESGLPHAAHAIADLLILLWHKEKDGTITYR